MGARCGGCARELATGAILGPKSVMAIERDAKGATEEVREGLMLLTGGDEASAPFL